LYLYFSSTIFATSLAATPDQFAYLSDAVHHVSDQQVQSNFRLGVLENDSRVKVCSDAEEKEGRFNCDMLHRFIITGGPLVPFGPNLQEELVSQV
jgi:hypothetical protein